ncbi:MAG: protein kinase [Gemmatimonadales bacterium]
MTLNPEVQQPQMLGDHYRVERELGHGGMATVYLCTDTRSGEQAAVKVLRPELGSIVTKERFFREIAFASELEHPRIPRVLESGSSGELPYYAMDFVDGESLRDRLRREPMLPVNEVARIAAEMAKPIAYAHERGIVHRDIKPENILLRGNDVWVLDFGVARAIAGAAGERLTGTGITIGTPAYMSPEQVTGERDLDLRSDIYSFGCVVYEMLAGVPPFRGATPHILMASRFITPPRPLRAIRPEIPESVEHAVQMSMAKMPEARWRSAEEFAAALAPPKPAGAASDSTPASSADNELLAKLKEVFADLYDVKEEMKGGGMARLFLATDKALERRVVIKILPPDLVSPMMLARFKRESGVTARLQHPHILPVISAGVRDGLVHYIMPFIDGESLRSKFDKGQIPIVDGVRLLREVTDALAYAHRHGVIHRDIKPENILIQDGHAVLADFGIAAALTGKDEAEPGAPRLTGTGMSLGTVGYMAPEQALGESGVDARADIYAVGVVGYEIFCGSAPFDGATAQAILVAHLTREAPRCDEIRKDTPQPVADAIKRAMEKDPAMRFQTAAEFRDAIDAGAPMLSETMSLPKVNRRVVSRPWKRWKIAAPIAAVVIAIAIFIGIKMKGPTEASEGGVTIAVAPFNTTTSSLALWREGMVDILARYLDGVKPFRTISPTISIKGFPAIGDTTSARELARRTKAQYVIWGNITGTADGVALRVNMLNVQAGTVWNGEVTDTTAELAAGAATTKILTELGKTYVVGAVKQASFGSASIDAIRAFLEGEQLFRRTSWDSAAISYDKAIKFDSTFAVALRRAAQVGGWQRNGSDSLSLAYWLRAGAANHNLSPRDSLLLLSDSLSAAIAPLRSDSMNWNKLTRLFATVDAAASRYPDDPEIWYAVGEARFHHGYGSPVNINERQALDAFKRAIELDSAFAPAYVHAVELAGTLDGKEAGNVYTKAYLRLKPTDDEAEGIEIVDHVTSGSASTQVTPDPLLYKVSSDAVMAAYYTIRRWADPNQTAIQLLQSITKRPRTSPTFAADSARIAGFLPLQLAYRGHLADAYKANGDRPSRLFVEIAILGGIPQATADSVTHDWLTRGIPQSFLALPWFAQRGNTQAITVLQHRADSAARVGTDFARRGWRYRAASTRAYLTLLKNDTTAAATAFAALPDTLCIACYMDRLQAAKLLAAKGKLEEASVLLGQRLNTFITPAEILIAFERGRVASKLGKREDAIRAFRLVADAWSPGDPGLQPYVLEAKREISRLGG